MLEAIDDAVVFAALLETAEEWLRARGMRRVLGPYSLSMNDEIGVLVAGFDTPPMVGMPHSPPYYADRLEQAGYAKAKDLHALRVAVADLVTEHLERVERVTGQLRVEGRLRQRFLDPSDLPTRFALRSTSTTRRGRDWALSGLRPRRSADRPARANPAAAGVIFGLADGEVAAMLVALPNLNELLADLDGRLFPFAGSALVAIALSPAQDGADHPAGVRRRYRGTAISTALITLMLGRC